MPTVSISTKGKKTYLNDPNSFFVAGHHFSEGFKGFDPKGEVTIQSEETNRYDREALGVYIGTTKVGYVPRPLNTFLKHILRAQPRTFTLSSYDKAREYSEIQITMNV